MTKTRKSGTETLSADAIIAVARQIAETSGFAGVSTRAIAGRLNVTATALYYHFANKGEILDRLAEILTGEVPVPSTDLPWQDRIRRFILTTQEVLSRYPGLNSHLVRHTETRAGRRWTETVLAALYDAGFRGEALWRAFAMLIFFVNPRSLVERAPADLVVRSGKVTNDIQADATEYPALHYALSVRRSVHFDDYYAVALDGIIKGLEAELSAFLTEPDAPAQATPDRG